jgi:hypothetical protein
MTKEFVISGNKAIMNFSQKYYDTSEALLNSDSFDTLVRCYISDNKANSTHIYTYLEKFFSASNIDSLTNELSDIIRFLNIMTIEEISSKINKYHDLYLEKEQLLTVIEGFTTFGGGWNVTQSLNKRPNPKV